MGEHKQFSPAELATIPSFTGLNMAANWIGLLIISCGVLTLTEAQAGAGTAGLMPSFFTYTSTSFTGFPPYFPESSTYSYGASSYFYSDSWYSSSDPWYLWYWNSWYSWELCVTAPPPPPPLPYSYYYWYDSSYWLPLCTIAPPLEFSWYYNYDLNEWVPPPPPVYSSSWHTYDDSFWYPWYWSSWHNDYYYPSYWSSYYNWYDLSSWYVWCGLEPYMYSYYDWSPSWSSYGWLVEQGLIDSTSFSDHAIPPLSFFDVSFGFALSSSWLIKNDPRFPDSWYYNDELNESVSDGNEDSNPSWYDYPLTSWEYWFYPPGWEDECNYNYWNNHPSLTPPDWSSSVWSWLYTSETGLLDLSGFDDLFGITGDAAAAEVIDPDIDLSGLFGK